MGANRSFSPILIFLIVGIVVAVFSDHGQASPEKFFVPADQQEQLDLDDAVQQFDGSVGQVERLKAEWLIYMADRYNVSTAVELAQVLVEAEADEVTNQSLEQIQSAERTLRRAGLRMLLDDDHDRLTEALLSMSDLGLILLLERSAYVLRHGPDGQGAVFVQVFHTSPALQQWLLTLLADDSSIVDMALEQSMIIRLQQLGISYPDIAWGWDDQVANRRILLPALQLLPVQRRLALLQDMVAGVAYPDLRADLIEVIEEGYLNDFVEIPDEWLRSRIESGETIWLGYVAGRDDDSDLPLLYQKIDLLELQQQLQLILIKPDPLFFPVVVSIHTDLMFSLPCSGHALDEALSSQADTLIQILLYLQKERPESLTLLAELADCLPPDIQSWSLSSAAALLLGHEDAAARSLAVRLNKDFHRIEIDPRRFHELWAVDPDAARQALQSRVPVFKERLLGQEEDIGRYRQCSSLALLLVANGHGLFDAWPEWVAEWTGGDLHEPVLKHCDYDLAMAVAKHPNAAVLDAMVALWESDLTSIESFMRLTRSILRTDGPQSDRKLALLTDYLHETGRWDELPLPYPAMLEGRVGLDALHLSCEPSSDWEPDADEEQEPELVTAE